MSRKGIFVSFEGGEGSGKSTQVKKLESFLKEKGFGVEVTREPGGVHIAEHIRDILLDQEHTDMEPLAELLLYGAARAQFVPKVLRPALAENDFVLSDRYTDSTEAYQGYGRRIDLGIVQEVMRIARKGLLPQVTYLLDVDPTIGVQRASKVAITRFEKEALDFHHRVRRGFLAIAEREPERVIVINAAPSMGEVFQAILKDFYCRFSSF